ncbi:RagB/SusD family nutrient uptake outer membrane protein [Sphingobacterium lumbrici]|uniref:RagB/SusD family nutrient uptake outer membrane protein n=1 Tax=Sphingobacterium lumbrici TaxID=2559600 RepID=UPI00112D86C8|nr:RagB/SusD family nutrient uptake outer membrane protein [Sphingobacterium lumbrici]
MKKLKINKRLFKFALAAVLLLQTVACDKFLEVQPRDYMFEKEAFSTEKGVEATLNALYQSLAEAQLYGDQMTLNMIEQFGQYYYAQGFGAQAYLKDFNYTQASVKSLVTNVWKGAYRSLLGVNNFCDKLSEPGFDVLNREKQDILLGEAHAIRAFLHFDQLRLFGPVYQKDPDALSIPYIRSATAVAQPLLPANEVIVEIMKDLTTAMTLLDKDPVRTTGANRIGQSESGAGVDYMSNRHRRFNYFAVKALAARVLLYAGMKAEAWEAVSSVMEAHEGFFPWLTELEFARDPLLSKESFFGIENKRMYEIYRDRFSPLVKDEDIFAVLPARLNMLYDPASTDLRLKYWFKAGTEGNKSYQVLVKQSEGVINDEGVRYYQPLIRKSELYLIAAETSPVLEQGYGYLNKLRLAKGLAPIAYNAQSSATALLNVVRDEYQREFIGEGQVFFLFKRLNMPTIPAVTGVGSVSMNDAKYIVPLPEDEAFYR